MNDAAIKTIDLSSWVVFGTGQFLDGCIVSGVESITGFLEVRLIKSTSNLFGDDIRSVNPESLFIPFVRLKEFKRRVDFESEPPKIGEFMSTTTIAKKNFSVVATRYSNALSVRITGIDMRVLFSHMFFENHQKYDLDDLLQDLIVSSDDTYDELLFELRELRG